MYRFRFVQQFEIIVLDEFELIDLSTFRSIDVTFAGQPAQINNGLMWYM